MTEGERSVGEGGVRIPTQGTALEDLHDSITDRLCHTSFCCHSPSRAFIQIQRHARERSVFAGQAAFSTQEPLDACLDTSIMNRAYNVSSAAPAEERDAQ